MKFCATILIFLLAFPAPLFAQDASALLAEQPQLDFVEKPASVDCAPDFKCLDLENYKLYLQMRVQYVWLHRVHVGTWPAIVAELKKSADAIDALAAVQAERADRSEAAYGSLLNKYEAAVYEGEEAKAMSLWGGGLPWVILFAVGGIAAGTVLGIYLETKLGN